MDYGLKPLGREKFWLWAMLTPTLIGLVFGALGSDHCDPGPELYQMGSADIADLGRTRVNYIDLFKDRKDSAVADQYHQILGALCSRCGHHFTIVAVLLNRKIRGLSLFRTAYFLPAVTSAVATALVWKMIYGRDTGILNFILERLGMQAVCWLCTGNAMYSVVIVNIWGAIGEGMIIFLAGLTAIPREYYEAAELDGANGTNQFFRITVPLAHAQHFLHDTDHHDQCVSGL